MNISENELQNSVDYGLNSIDHICGSIGGRESGSKNERRSQEWIKSEIEKNKWADKVDVSEFKISSKGLVGFTKIVSVIVAFAVLLQIAVYFTNGLVSMVLNVISIIMPIVSLIMFVCEFLLYKEFIDPMLKKSTSSNLFATYSSSGEVHRRIVFSGHTDSAYEWTLMKKSPVLMILVLVGCLIGAVAYIGIFAATFVIGSLKLWELILVLCMAPAFIALYFYCDFRVIVDGANDNLTGVFASIGVLKSLAEEGIRFEHTEVCALCTGSEEAGLRGAKAWAKKYKPIFDKEENVETIVVALETLKDWNYFSNYVRDMTMTVGHDKGVIRLIERGCKAAGRDIPKGSVFFGASDAAAVSKAGMRSGCLAGMDPKPASYYHNTRDNSHNMDRPSFEFGIRAAIEMTEIFDKEGAKA